MIRQLGPTDAEAWKAFRIEMLTESPQSFGSTLAEASARDLDSYAQMLTTCTVLVDDDNGFQASAAWQKVDGQAATHRAFLFAVYVRPEARGKGHAQRLVEAACAGARQAGHIQIELNVNAANTGAVALYERLGFVKFGLHPRALCVDGVMSDDHLMVRALD